MTPARNVARGEDAGSAKLTADKVLEIRRRHDEGESQSQLAREFGVGRRSIGHIVTLKTWRHV